MTIKLEVFLNLNHENIVLKLNIATAVIVMVLLVAELLEKGSYCNPKMAWAIVSLLTGLKVNVKDFAIEGNEKHLPLVLIILALAFVCFAIFAVISTVRRSEEALTQQNNEINVQGNREQVNSYNSSFGSNTLNVINHVRVPIDLPLVEPHRTLPNTDKIVTTLENVNIQPVNRLQPKRTPIPIPIPQLTYVASFKASTTTTPLSGFLEADELPIIPSSGTVDMAQSATKRSEDTYKDKDDGSQLQISRQKSPQTMPEVEKSPITLKFLETPEIVNIDMFNGPILFSTGIVGIENSNLPSGQPQSTVKVEISELALPTLHCQITQSQLIEEVESGSSHLTSKPFGVGEVDD